MLAMGPPFYGRPPLSLHCIARLGQSQVKYAGCLFAAFSKALSNLLSSADHRTSCQSRLVSLTCCSSDPEWQSSTLIVVIMHTGKHGMSMPGCSWVWERAARWSVRTARAVRRRRRLLHDWCMHASHAASPAAAKAPQRQTVCKTACAAGGLRNIAIPALCSSVQIVSCRC